MNAVAFKVLVILLVGYFASILLACAQNEERGCE